eukprot:TRINITY_DN7215_c0_g1_i2.p1 TRINITY_DN7215_c0_g1~~TRINITY_DN7215_c0_g1_i2.p1  ORF type:complete len:1084 (-),score=147.51 TRINITY_DN7215_c0_g1_i2:11-3262(-)
MEESTGSLGTIKQDLSLVELAQLILTRIDRLGNSSSLSLGPSCAGHIMTLPSCVGTLTRLRSLSIYRNKMESICESVKELRLLKELNIYQNEVSTFPDIFGSLTDLRELNLSENKLIALPQSISALKNLTKLDAHGNMIEIFGPEMSFLDQLSILNLSENQISHLGQSISSLKSLSKFNISVNKLTTLPSSMSLMSALVDLNIADNQISVAPAWIKNIRSLAVLKLDRNPIQYPCANADRIGLYELHEKLALSENPVNLWKDARLIIVGEKETGKSSLTRQLLKNGNVPDRKSFSRMSLQLLSPLDTQTPCDDGVNISYETLDLNTPNHQLHIRIWDVGGQSRFAMASPFLFSLGSIVVLTWNVKLSLSTNKIKNWLDDIQAVAPVCRIILVGTHQDHSIMQNPTHRKSMEDELSRIKERFEKRLDIVGVYYVSNLTGENVSLLKEAIFSAFKGHPSLPACVPLCHIYARDRILLRARTSDPPIMTYREFQDLIEGCSSKIRPKSVLQLMHDSGLVIWHDRGDLGDLIICDPSFLFRILCSFAYFILNTRGTGFYDLDAVKCHLNEYFPKCETYILELMRSFDLSFPASDGKYEVFPTVLPPGPPPPNVWQHNPPLDIVAWLATTIKFTCLPKNLFGLMVARLLATSMTSLFQSGVCGMNMIYFSSSHAVIPFSDPRAASPISFYHMYMESNDVEYEWTICIRSNCQSLSPRNGLELVLALAEDLMKIYIGIEFRVDIICPFCYMTTAHDFSHRTQAPYRSEKPSDSKVSCVHHPELSTFGDWLCSSIQQASRIDQINYSDVPSLFWAEQSNENSSLRGNTRVYLVCDRPRNPHLTPHPGYLVPNQLLASSGISAHTPQRKISSGASDLKDKIKRRLSARFSTSDVSWSQDRLLDSTEPPLGEDLHRSDGIQISPMASIQGVDITKIDPSREWEAYLKATNMWTGHKRYLCPDCHLLYEATVTRPSRPEMQESLSGYMQVKDDGSRKWKRAFVHLNSGALTCFADHHMNVIIEKVDLTRLLEVNECFDADAGYCVQVCIPGKVYILKVIFDHASQHFDYICYNTLPSIKCQSIKNRSRIRMYK